MMNILKKPLALASAALLLASCSDWTKVESVDLKSRNPWESNPYRWEQYWDVIRTYKQGRHYTTYMRFENSSTKITSEKNFLRCLPDSLDIVSLTNGENFSAADAEDMEWMKKVGTKVLYQLNLSTGIDVATAIEKAIATVKENALDGYSFTASSKDIATTAVSILSEAKSGEQILAFEGYHGFIAKEDVEKVDIFVLATESVENTYDLGEIIEDAASQGISKDKMILAASMNGAFYNSDNVELPVLEAMADNVINFGPLKGIAFYDAQSDYYHYTGNWMTVNSVIARLNPSPSGK